MKQFNCIVFIVFAINCITISLAVRFYGRTFTTDGFGNSIIIENGIINCGGLICPENTFKCIITRNTTGDNNYVETTKTCMAADNTPLAQTSNSTPNPRPGTTIQTYESATINGNLFQCNNCNGYDSQEIKDNIKRTQDRVNRQMKHVHDNVARQMQHVQRHMQHVQQHVDDTMRRVNQQVNNIGLRFNKNFPFDNEY